MRYATRRASDATSNGRAAGGGGWGVQYLRVTRIRRDDFDSTENDIATGPPTDDDVGAPDAMPVVEGIVDGEPANDTDEQANTAA